MFKTKRAEALAESAIRSDERSAATDIDFAPDAEGRAYITRHVRYERSRANRARAIEIHGTACKVCGFDFNAVYGADFARDFIQVHHTRSVTELDDTPPDIESELLPLCSNCHSMAHREPGRMVSLKELTERMRPSPSGGAVGLLRLKPVSLFVLSAIRHESAEGGSV